MEINKIERTLIIFLTIVRLTSSREIIAEIVCLTTKS